MVSRGLISVYLCLAPFAPSAAAQCTEVFRRVREPGVMQGSCDGIGIGVDGPLLIVSTPCSTTEDGFDMEYAVAYRWNEARARWDFEQRLFPAVVDIDGFQFGTSIDLDQNNAVIGGYGGVFPEFAGYAYFFERSPAGVWTRTNEFRANVPVEDDTYGWSVAVDGDRAVISAIGENDKGAVYFYKKTGSSWSQTQRIGSPFLENQVYGWSVDLSGNRAVVGSPKQAGNKAIVYRLEGDNWVQEQILTGDDTSIGDEFGHAVAISGETIAVGARLHNGAAGVNAGAIYTFDLAPDSGVWVQTQRIEWTLGGGRLTDTVAPTRGLALEGDEMIAAARISDLTQRYRRQENGTWVTTGVSEAATGVAMGGGTIAAGEGRPGEQFVDVTRCADMDTDGDGLLDKWETEGQGYDVNLDGIIDINLYDRGARPDRKDLFYELDRMVGIPYDENAIVDVIESFALSPVSNPDGSTGITLHIDLSANDDIPADSEWVIPPDGVPGFGIEFEVAKDLYWGDPAERVDSNAEYILEAKRDIYRYAVLIDEFSDGTLGIAETPGNDMICAIGEMAGDRHLQASTFMHEMGHNLNLSHGGVEKLPDDDGGDPNLLGSSLPTPDNTNYKPNYVSVMNYGFDEFRDAQGDKLSIDYSREVLPALDESDLNELQGIPSAEYGDVWVFYGIRIPGEQPEPRRIQINSGGIDWDGSGTLTSGTTHDINWVGPGYPGGDSPSRDQILGGCNDWEHIILPFADIAAYERSVAVRPTGYTELTYAGLQSIRDNTPPAPVGCNAADLATPFGTLDLSDISVFVTAFVAQSLDADFDDNGILDLQDISIFVTAFSAGCP